MKQDLQPLKGFRDFLPEQARKRDYALNLIKQTFQNFGFEPLETPTLEYQSLLLGKYGTEADKLVYKFEDEGKRQIGLRYDQTVPTARVIASSLNQLGIPFKRYQIQPVWRAEKPQKGRFREFLQCDIDTFGTTSSIADAEIITASITALKNLGLGNLKMLLNSRLLLFEMIEQANITEKDALSVIQSLDKLEKIGRDGVVKELSGKGLSTTTIDLLFDLITKAKPNVELQQVISACLQLGLTPSELEFSPTLARGLDYYTGTIFELVSDDYPVGSLAGGGRYDNLVGRLSGTDIPAVGIALGFDRIIEAMETLNLFPDNLVPAKVFVTFSDSYLQEATLNLVTNLQKQNISTFLYPNPEDKLTKQLKLANKKQIPYLIILGTQEAKLNKFTLKDMTTGVQQLLTLNDLLTTLQK